MPSENHANCFIVQPRTYCFDERSVRLSERYAYLLPIEERWWKRFLKRSRAGEKVHAYVRRGTVGPNTAKLILFYVTHPRKEIRGIGDFVDRVPGKVDDLWKKHGRETCLESREEYLKLMDGRPRASFILFENLRELTTPVLFKRVSEVTGTRRMHPMCKYIDKEKAQKLTQGTEPTTTLHSFTHQPKNKK